MAQRGPNVGVPEEYFGTRFHVESQPVRWPDSFTIVTAWAPTGEVWAADRNRQADSGLRARLAASGWWFHRITGYDPKGDHAEPGWAIEQTLAQGLELALEFKQLGIFHVDAGELWAVMCADPEGLKWHVAPFFERLDPGAPIPPDPSRNP